MVDSAGTGRSAKLRTDAFTFVLHWALVAVLVISLLTGLRIAADYDESIAGRLASSIDWLLLKGRVIDWHVIAGWTLTFVSISYAAFVWRSRQAMRVKLDRTVLRSIAQARRSGRLWSSISAWFAINVVVYQMAFALIALMALTGWMLYSGVRFGLSAYTVSTVHGIAAWSFILYVVLHVLTQLKAGNFWKIFRPRLDYTVAAGIAVVMSATAVTAAYLADRGGLGELRIAKVQVAPVLDGDASDAAWRKARTVAIHTMRGANLPNGEVTVHVGAVHDGERVYLKFRWADPQRSQKHLPLVKTEAGWRVRQSAYETNDETAYYEDKLAVLLSRRAALATGTVHLGQDLVEGPHQPITRGLHFTDDGSIADLWHWKSVRTGGMSPGFADDDYFGPPMPSNTPKVRYTGGYTQDPKQSGGYTLNWTKVDPDKPLGDTLVVPKFLRGSPEVLARMGEPALDPEAGDAGVWFMNAAEAVPYDPELDDYPVGTVLPGVVIDGPFTGDRGDVLAAGQWREGHWTVEMSRLLDTGSQFDLPLAPGRDAYLWVAVFNHNQTRHSQHLHPVRLVLD
ncbi:MAG: ethylbenzene dehydrogenase-related protein [Geminicoccales bacterium]